MDTKKDFGGINLILVGIILILLGIIVFIFTGVISLGDSSISKVECDNNVNTSNNNSIDNSSDGNVVSDCKCDSKSEFKLDAAKLKEVGGSADHNSIVFEHFDQDTSIRLLTDGRVLVKFEHYISNISNAKDMILLTPPGPVATLYILTEDGDIYKYSSEDFESGNYTATKVEGYSNIKYITKYMTNKINAGGNTVIIAIDADGNYYKVDGFSV